MFDVEPFKPRIVELCRRSKVCRLDLIGPAAVGDCAGESEIDILVQFEHDEGLLFNRFFDLKEGLERVLGRLVDVTVEETVRNPEVWESIEQSRKTVYAA
ncbi:MAG: nucleotidyltransferase domain-containing protein [Phycisphaerales bacterium]|jgi:predicted nucleotidyltransferase